MKENKKPFSRNNPDSKPAPPSNSSTHDFPPKLTEEERNLLMEHSGCLKCRCFYTGHRAHQCTTTISSKNYKTLTSQDAQRAKSSHNTKASSSFQITTIASISDPNTSKTGEDLVTAVFLNLSSSINIGNGSFSGCLDSGVSCPPHIKSKHFIWNCLLMGPSVTYPIVKPSLIDNGCHMVLIHPDLVAQSHTPDLFYRPLIFFIFLNTLLFQ